MDSLHITFRGLEYELPLPADMRQAADWRARVQFVLPSWLEKTRRYAHRPSVRREFKSWIADMVWSLAPRRIPRGAIMGATPLEATELLAELADATATAAELQRMEPIPDTAPRKKKRRGVVDLSCKT